MDEAMRPYRGIRVLDAGQGIAAPYCATLLAACGADVIKLEPPEGDWSRGLTTSKDTVSVLSVCFNRGKRSVVLDLKSREGQAAAKALAANCDVLIEAFRPGVAARIGLGVENTREDAICLSISGFGQTGPNAERPCTDSVAQAFSGYVAMNTGADGVPHKANPFVSDMTTGVWAFVAIQTALAARAQDKAPRRRHIDLSLMMATSFLMTANIAETAYLGRTPAMPNTPAGAYRTMDDRWVMITLVRNADFTPLCEVLGLKGVAEDPRYATFDARWENRESLYAMIRAAFATKAADEWVAALQGKRLLADHVNTIADWLGNPHVQAVHAVASVAQPQLGAVPMPALPGLGHWSAPAPALGEHTKDILAELGL